MRPTKPDCTQSVVEAIRGEETIDLTLEDVSINLTLDEKQQLDALVQKYPERYRSFDDVMNDAALSLFEGIAREVGDLAWLERLETIRLLVLPVEKGKA